MAIYYHCFDSLFSIAVVASFIVALILSANVISGLLLTPSKRAFIFTITSREAFFRPWRQDCKGFFEGWYGPTGVFFRD